MVCPRPSYDDLIRENLRLKEEMKKFQTGPSKKISGKTGKGEDYFQDRFYSILEHVKFVVYQYSILKGGYLYISPQAYSIFGYAPEEFYRNPMLVRKLIHPDSFSSFKEHWKKLLRGEVPDFYEMKVINRNNKVLWVQQSNLLIRNKKGEPEAIEGVVIDITEQKLAEEALRQSELQKRSFLNNLPHLAWLKDVHGVYIVVNESFARRRKLTVEEITGKTDYDIYSRRDAEKYRKEDGWIIKSKEACFFEEKSRNLWFETFKAPIMNENNEVTGVTGISLDITKRKHIDEELKSYSKKLSEQNEVLRIINIELVRAKERAEESDRLKSSFLANMSHEIRTPMNAILGFSELMKSKKFSDEQKDRFIDIINSKSRQLLQIITDIIDISKIESGQIKIVDKNFSVNDLIADLEITFNSMQQQKKKPIRLVTNLEQTDENSWIFADNLRIEQILTNFLSNAYKFTEKGEIELGYQMKEDKSIVFYVRDTGIGIGKDELKFIFDPFRQVSISYDRSYGGTGLGLTISRGLAKRLGGSIWVESEINKGSTFYLKIPFKKGEESKETIKHISEIYNWENKTILIAEDEEANFEFFKMLLISTKAKIIRAVDGFEAVEKSKDLHVSLVLMDIKLPGLDGLEATKVIKKNRKTLPVIAQTAYAMSSDEQECLNAGCDAYISKPILIEAFLRLIDQFI
ncbi:MAG TPA: ATP-binding protein [Bacteroidales bacterium]|nr:ATP-binding protein [Bacteroidales bacterium]